MPPPDFLHNHPDYKDLIQTVSDNMGIAPDLIEKDYWIMHCLYGLAKQGYSFELKGGTSLSKGFGIIHRFSEDIDIRIQPEAGNEVFTGKNQNKPKHQESRKSFYDGLSDQIGIDGIEEIVRDEAFDDPKYRSGGIRLKYPGISKVSDGVKEGVLLEVGFDTATPNQPVDISSWAFDFAREHDMQVIDNRAMNVLCYEPRYTFVEKLQTVATKYRRQQETGDIPKNFMRHYYDLYCLLDNQEVIDFIGTDKYRSHKIDRFPKQDYEIPIAQNEAFLLTDPDTRSLYEKSYQETRSLYYEEQPSFDQLLDRLQSYIEKL